MLKLYILFNILPLPPPILFLLLTFIIISTDTTNTTNQQLSIASQHPPKYPDLISRDLSTMEISQQVGFKSKLANDGAGKFTSSRQPEHPNLGQEIESLADDPREAASTPVTASLAYDAQQSVDRQQDQTINIHELVERSSGNGDLDESDEAISRSLFGLGSYQAEEVINKTPSGLLRLRGFDSRLYYARTPDGYNIHLVRIVNPNLPLDGSSKPLKRPVIFNHGLFESATIWLMNARHVKPTGYSHQCGQMPQPSGVNASDPKMSHWRFLNGPMMLSNNGYDVWLMSMRGTEFSLKHVSRKVNDSSFWDYSLDDFALQDIPTVIDFVRRKTGVEKVSYIGHSQATLTMFALLSSKPYYADRIEPVIAVAPVSYFSRITSIARSLFDFIKLTSGDRVHGPFPPNAKKIRKTQSWLCDSNLLSGVGCQFMELLIAGQGKRWLTGFYNHMPHYTSLKVLRQFQQFVETGRFASYDYGPQVNMRVYGSERNPDYKIANIRSRSICLFATRTDALSAPEDIERFKSELTVPLYKDVMIEGKFNHFDLISHPDSRKLVFEPILKILETFEQKSNNSATCKSRTANGYSPTPRDNRSGRVRQARQLVDNTDAPIRRLEAQHFAASALELHPRRLQLD